VHSPAAAIAWEFRQRHRWGLVALVVYLTVLAAVKLVILGHNAPIDFDSAATFAFVFVVPFSAYFTYFIAVFTFGFDGDLAARQSMYPARMFTRPVSSAALAGWPMLFGAVVSVFLWIATRLLALWPSSLEVPVVWPGFLAVVLLAWAQALTWMPYALPGARLIAVILWLTAIDVIVILAIHFRVSEPLMIAFLLPQIPLAYLVARYGVARARRGDIPDWSGAFTWLARLSGGSGPRRQFSSAAGAQAWFEWRLSGKSLPVWVAIILPFDLLLFWVAGSSTGMLIELLVGVFLIPIIIATFAAATVSKPSVNVSDSYGLPPFMATRPLTDAQLVAAKLKTALTSTALAWLLIIVAVPIALEWSGEMPLAVENARRFAQVVGAPRAVVFLLLVVAAFIAATWKQLVQTLYIGLTGRAWLIKGSIFATLTFLFFIGPIAEWIIDTGRLGKLWSTLPLIFTLLVCVKMSAAAWIATSLYRYRLLSDRVLVAGAACWCVAVFALYGVLVWMLDTPHIPHYLLLLLAILATPLARLSAAPLALAWNRHR
jgi:hypothetical protein